MTAGHVEITPETLVAAGDCGEGVALLEAIGMPEGYIGPWTLAHQCAVLWHPGARRRLAWLVRNGIVPLWAMSKIRAPRADLREASLHKADLSGANLSGVDLSEANLSEANLAEANLHKADLAEANLATADLSGANLHKANLHRANLIGADLSGASLRGANLHKANLTAADLAAADLIGANLGGWERGPDGYARRAGGAA